MGSACVSLSIPIPSDGIDCTDASIDQNSLKPTLATDSKHAAIEISGRKYGADSMNIYYRIKGQAAFRLLAAKRVRFPFTDDTPPAIPGALEEREYQGIGVIGDDEVGQPSDIVSAVFKP